MKKIQILLMAMVAVFMSSCGLFKTEATVDVEVTQNGAPLSGITVYKFLNNGVSTLYKSNAAGSAQTNAGGVAHFDLKSPDDFTPSSVAGISLPSESNTFHFCTYDANDDRNAMVSVTVNTGDHKTVQLEVPVGLVNPEELDNL